MPTEQDSVIPCDGLKCDSPSRTCASQRMKCEGRCQPYLFYLPRVFNPFSNDHRCLFPSYLTWIPGSAMANTIDDTLSTSGRHRPTPGPALAVNPDRSHSHQCLQKNDSPAPDPCDTSPVDSNSSGSDSGSRGDVRPTLRSLERLKQSLKQKTDLFRFTLWIVGSDFLRLQQLEPIVGDAPISYPPFVDEYGLKGQSLYTAFFDHLDMQTFVCWDCGHTVEEDLDAAIVHQRAVHFRHEPYRCHALNGMW